MTGHRILNGVMTSLFNMGYYLFHFHCYASCAETEKVVAELVA